jgi:hypothetical protein
MYTLKETCIWHKCLTVVACTVRQRHCCCCCCCCTAAAAAVCSCSSLRHWPRQPTVTGAAVTRIDVTKVCSSSGSCLGSVLLAVAEALLRHAGQLLLLLLLLLWLLVVVVVVNNELHVTHRLRCDKHSSHSLSNSVLSTCVLGHV